MTTKDAMKPFLGVNNKKVFWIYVGAAVGMKVNKVCTATRCCAASQCGYIGNNDFLSILWQQRAEIRKKLKFCHGGYTLQGKVFLQVKRYL